MKKFLLTAFFAICYVGANAQFSNYNIYCFQQEHHSSGGTAWAVEHGGNVLQSTRQLNIAVSLDDPRQQFALLSINNRATQYLYHIAEQKFVNKDGTLGTSPRDAIYSEAGAYGNTYVFYFDDEHYINVGGSTNIEINSWRKADGGNSSSIYSVGKTSNADLPAHFRKSHKLTIRDTDGRILSAQDVAVGAKIEYPSLGQIEGHSFYWSRRTSSNFVTADMLYTNAPCTTNAYGDQFEGWHVLFDGYTSTKFHSDYNNGVNSEDGLDHYIRVDMGSSRRITNFVFSYTTRNIDNNNNVSPKTIIVEGSNSASGDYSRIAYLTDLPGTRSTVYSSEELGNGYAYRYIRFRVIETHGGSTSQGHPYFAISEFAMQELTGSTVSIPKIMSDEDVIVDAVWTPNNYLLTHIDEVSRYTQSLTYGTNIQLNNESLEKILYNSIINTSNASSMLYTNAPCTNTSYGDEFESWDVLFDDNATTTFHSEYGSNKETVDGLDHYLRVDMGENNSIDKFRLSYSTRNDVENNNNYSPKTIIVEGSNSADGSYTEIAILPNLPGTRNTRYTSDDLSNGTAYRYIRFRITETHNNHKDHGHPYFVIAEFSMSKRAGISTEVPTTMPAEDIVVVPILTSADQISNIRLYHINQPHHTASSTAWAVANGGSALSSNHDLGMIVDIDSPCQQFAFITNDGGNTHYLYHAAEKMFIGKDGSLTESPTDAVYFKNGHYDNTLIVYFDNSHYINVGEVLQMTIDSWSTPDGGNSCVITPVGTFDPTEALKAFGLPDAGIEKSEIRNEKPEIIYDLQGRRITHPTKGIYIINGKMVVIK